MYMFCTETAIIMLCLFYLSPGIIWQAYIYFWVKPPPFTKIYSCAKNVYRNACMVLRNGGRILARVRYSQPIGQFWVNFDRVILRAIEFWNWTLWTQTNIRSAEAIKKTKKLVHYYPRPEKMWFFSTMA